jgi:hypothetical protein
VLLELLIFAAFALVLLLMGWASAESRPDFIDPGTKHQPVTAQIRLDGKNWY